MSGCGDHLEAARADLKRQVAGEETSAADVVLTCPWEAESMAISDLLMSQRRWGITRCRKLLQTLPMSENKSIGSMTDRQRHALAALLSPAPAAAVAARPAPNPGLLAFA